MFLKVVQNVDVKNKERDQQIFKTEKYLKNKNRDVQVESDVELALYQKLS